MNIVTWLQPLLWRKRLNPPTDLESWRDWLVSTMAICALIALPLGMVATFPIYVMEKRYGLIGFDIGVLLLVIVQLSLKPKSYKYQAYFWLAVLYIMTITFFIALGPYHARPAWLVMCAIMAALLFGARAAVLSTGVNAAILMVLYWLIGPENQAWASEYAAPFSKWMMFVVNVSIIMLASSGAAGFLLDRLDRSLKNERDTRNRLLAESEKLNAAHSTLKAQVEERRRSEEALSESEERYRTLFEQSRDAIYITSKEGEILDANQSMLDLFGYSREEMIGFQAGETYVYPEDRLRFQQEIEREGFVRDHEIELRKKDGTEMDCLLTATVRRTAVGNILGYQGIIRDITERKRVEDEYRTILRTAMDGFWITDIQGRFLDVNEAYCRLIGYNRDELLNMRISDVESIERPEETAQRIQRIMETGGDRFETRHKCKDGRIIDIEVSVNYMKIGNERLFVFLRDITERKCVEEERGKLIHELQEALAHIKALRGLLPICSYCKKIRDDKGYWNQIESYIRDHSDAEFTHGMCPECLKKLYPDLVD